MPRFPKLKIPKAVKRVYTKPTITRFSKSQLNKVHGEAIKAHKEIKKSEELATKYPYGTGYFKWSKKWER